MPIVRKLQRTKKDQYIITIPKSLIMLLDWKEQDQVEFGFEDGKITLKKSTKGKRGGRSEK